MLNFGLTHPTLIGALAAAGHGSQVLVADGNYPHSTGVNPSATRIYLNLAPGLLDVDDVLKVLVGADRECNGDAAGGPVGARGGLWLQEGLGRVTYMARIGPPRVLCRGQDAGCGDRHRYGRPTSLRQLVAHHWRPPRCERHHFLSGRTTSFAEGGDVVRAVRRAV
jgi:RbsD / FucU transport protein family.